MKNFIAIGATLIMVMLFGGAFYLVFTAANWNWNIVHWDTFSKALGIVTVFLIIRKCYILEREDRKDIRRRNERFEKFLHKIIRETEKP